MAFKPQPVMDGLICWLDGRDGSNEEQTSVWVDRSGNGNNMTLNGFTFSSTVGWHSGFLRFNKPAWAHLSLPTRLLKEYCIEVRFKKPKACTSEYGRIFHGGLLGSTTYDNFGTDMGTNSIYGGANNICPYVRTHMTYEGASKFTCVGETEYSLVLQKTLTSFEVTLNGEKKRTANFTGDYIFEFLRLNYEGGSSYSHGNEFDVKSVRIYNRALTEAEIKQNYNYELNKDKTDWFTLKVANRWQKTSYKATSVEVPKPRLKFMAEGYTNYLPLEPEPEVILPPTEPITDGLICWLDGRDGSNEEQTSVWVDRSGNGNDATLHGFTFNSTSGWTGNGLKFNGTNNYGSIPNNNNFYHIGVGKTFEITLSFDSANSKILGMMGNTSARGGWRGRFGIYKTETGPIMVYVDDGNTVGITTPQPQVLQKTTYHAVIDGNKLKVYEKGNLIGEKSHTLNNYTSRDLFLIGTYGNETGTGNLSYSYLDGEVASIRVYNRALTEAEIKHNYDYEKQELPKSRKGDVSFLVGGEKLVVGEVNPITDGLICWLDGRDGSNEEQTRTWVDRSGNGNNAVFNSLPCTSVEGWTGKSLRLNKSKYGVITGNNQVCFVDDDEFTVEFTFTNTDSTGQTFYNSVISGDHTRNWYSWTRKYSTMEVAFFMANTGISSITVTTPCDFTTKTTITMVCKKGSSGYMRRYVNGKLDLTSPGSSNAFSVTSVYVGNSVSVPTNQHKGEIFSIRLYNKALTEAEIKHNYDYEQSK